MTTEQNFFEHDARFESNDNGTLKQKCNPTSVSAAVSDNGSGSFDCNICLDSAHDPVVTLCGHLYCWPCIYKWFHVKNSSLDSVPQQPNCPVCKANISSNSLVPLYSHGTSTSDSESNKSPRDLVIPPRPPHSGLNALISNTSHQTQQLHANFFQSQSQSFHHQQYFPNPYEGYAAMASSNLGVTAMTSFFNPVIGMVGELVLARIFGTSNTGLYSNPFAVNNSSSSSPRIRRQEMQIEKSLNRVTVFLLCCIFLCLLLF